ncbi:bifunctional oligoribonuclease and PAP phosphatase NrnA [Candidatus Gastranaerophilus sp. (ex Termes propinquus)]|nr:bifunctional oligoribonuclease and PAP phosphatase NrnA [Candidatus Gastranaerophilus sp. (ex Termes propinquus)]
MITQIFEQIKNADKILIISHISPDGDTLGSMCALKLVIGEKADMLVQNMKDGGGVPDVYKFLPGIESAKTLKTVGDTHYDLIITVDVASIDRIVQPARKIFDSCENTICIDHHKTNKGFAKINVNFPSASSCGEVLYNIFTEQEIEITKDMADCLYVAILTDTGCFKYETTSVHTFEIAAKLVSLGVDSADLASRCYDNKPKSMVMFQAHFICNAKFLHQNRLCYTTIRERDIEKFSAKDEYTEGICESLRSINTVEVAFVMKEIDKNAVKVSLRSKFVDLTKITARFSGGGHWRAAGCTIHKSLEIAQRLLIEEIEKHLLEPRQD